MHVAEVAPHEDTDPIQITRWQQLVARFMVVTATVPIVLAMWAMKIQATTIMAQAAEGKLSGVNLAVAWALVGLEFVSLTDTIPAALVKGVSIFGRWRPRLRLLGENVPSVDVIIPVCNEKLDIIQDTIRAALNIDYPLNRFRVIVSDDGANQKLEAWVLQHAEALGPGANLYYTARVKYGPSGYKAGNLNHAVMISDRLPGGRAELIAGLDADMIPERRWLRAVVAHIVRDPKMGMVCPTQLFYNVPACDPFNQCSLVNWLALDTLRDQASAGWNLGSGWVVRREAVDDIGGFPTDCLVEDICSSMLKIAAGWRTAYIAEALQYGLVPESYGAHVKQFVRWVLHWWLPAIYQVPGLPLAQIYKKMPFLTRVVGFSMGLNIHFKPQLSTFYLFLGPTIFMTNTHFIYWRGIEEFKLLLRLHCAMIFLTYIQEVHLAILTGFRVAINEKGVAKFMSPYYTVAWLKTFVLPSWLGGKPTGFTPTGSIANDLQERNVTLRAPLSARLRHLLVDCMGWVHLLMITALCSLAFAQVRQVLRRHSDTNTKEFWIELLETVAWPSGMWVPTVLGCLTPFSYMMFPPDVPERDKLMGKRGPNGVRYPTEDAKMRKGGFRLDFTFWYSLFMVYVAAAFIGSWWL
ncbi:cellulose synthase 2 [Podospora australis]|uniref:Cellulose synthase 2 n=1 Tax=Podospora australis TaxID=1536484 RepID=A0AAN6X204_9PEZI|nr:cellulose synthase 2 [Podospora australis]